MIDDLYSNRVLKLAAHLPRTGRLDAPDGTGEAVSKLCGSTATVDVRLADGRIAEFAQDVKACALGQAAASVLGEHVVGATPEEVIAARDALFAMLKSAGAPPQGRFADLALLEQVRDYPARHASTLVAWDAAVQAVRRATAHDERTSLAGAA